MNEKLRVFLSLYEIEAALFLVCLFAAALFANFIVKRILLLVLERLLYQIPFGPTQVFDTEQKLIICVGNTSRCLKKRVTCF